VIVEVNKGSKFLDEGSKADRDFAKVPLKCKDREFYLVKEQEAKTLMIKIGTLSEEEREMVNESMPKISYKKFN